VTFDSSIPVADVEGEIDAVLVSYSRGLEIAGKSALLTLAVPYANVALEGLYLGQPASGERQGMGDPFIRFAVNFYGAPALAPEEYAAYRQKTIVGASIAVGVPVGRYDEDRVLNIGSNRWTVIGQIGASHQMRKWTVEASLGFAWFSDNDDLLETNTIEQDPIGLFRSTVLYHITRRLWVGAGLLYSHGGTTRLNGIRRDDRQQNWRTGVAMSIPLARGHTLQLRTTEGVTARIGSAFRPDSASYTYSFYAPSASAQLTGCRQCRGDCSRRDHKRIGLGFKSNLIDNWLGELVYRDVEIEFLAACQISWSNLAARNGDSSSGIRSYGEGPVGGRQVNCDVVAPHSPNDHLGVHVQFAIPLDHTHTGS
ncbi:MAG: transporter, partial [Pseudomonadales bacterium]